MIRSKLISDSFFDSMVACEDEVMEDVKRTIAEANEVEPGILVFFLSDSWSRVSGRAS